MIKSVALNGNAAGRGDETRQLGAGHTLRGGRAGVVVNLLLDNRAVDIVGAEAKCDLRDFRGHHLPVSLDVREVVEQQPADGDLADVGDAGGARQVVKRRVVGMERERDEGLEASGVVLEVAQADEMVHAVLVVFDMAVKHGGVGFEAELVRHAGGFQPFVAIDFVVADDVTDAVGEDLGAAAGHGVDACILQLLQGFGNGEFGALRKEGNLDHGEGLDVDLRKALLKAAHQIEEVLEGKVGMEAADDVELGDGLGIAGGSGCPGLFERHGVGARGAFAASESAEAAGGDTDIGRIDVAIDVEVRDVAMHALADRIGQPADGKHVGRVVESEAIAEAEALAGSEFAGDGQEAGIVRLKEMRRHTFMIRRAGAPGNSASGTAAPAGGAAGGQVRDRRDAEGPDEEHYTGRAFDPRHPLQWGEDEGDGGEEEENSAEAEELLYVQAAGEAVHNIMLNEHPARAAQGRVTAVIPFDKVLSGNNKKVSWTVDCRNRKHGSRFSCWPGCWLR